MGTLATYFDQILNYLTFLVGEVRYTGIFIAMFLESTFIPIPSEIIMIPVGVAAASGDMNLPLAITVGVVGNLAGALFNYFLSLYFGRDILHKICKYFLIKERAITRIEDFFDKHGAISIFIGRLIPGVRHYISLPAGLARMKLSIFCFYTLTGSAIWVTILTYLGYMLGENRELVKRYLDIIIIICLVLCVLLAGLYIIYNNKTKTGQDNPNNPLD